MLEARRRGLRGGPGVEDALAVVAAPSP